RSRALPLSPALGTRISGNGDALALSFRGDRGTESSGPRPDRVPGPTITETADIVTAYGRSLVQDGAFPTAVLPELRRALALFDKRWRALVPSDLGAGSRNRTQVWLAMGEDTASGRASLDRWNRLRIAWPG